MPIFYRGAGIGTYWHTNDARLNGFTPQSPGTMGSLSRLMNHIARGTTNSPFVSMTRSYGVALSYALLAGRTYPTPTNPAYVYEIEINDPLPAGLQLFDPAKEVAASVPTPLGLSYYHDGAPEFLLGVVSPTRMRRFLTAPYPQPPPRGGTSRPPNLTIELETLVRALRDAEILAIGTIPAACIRNRLNES